MGISSSGCPERAIYTSLGNAPGKDYIFPKSLGPIDLFFGSRTPGKDYIFPKSPERAIHKNKYMSRPFRADCL